MIPLAKLKENVSQFPGATAIIEGEIKITYEKMLLMAGNCVNNLVHKYGAHRYKCAVFIAENCYEMLIFMSAFSTLKVPFIGVDYTSSLKAKIYSIRSIGADCIVYTAAFTKDVKLITQTLPVKTICVDKEFAELTMSCENTPEFDASSINRPFESISFTSGTSGAPKTVYRTKPFDARRFSYLTERFGFNANDLFLVSVPFYHVSAMGWARLFLGLGATVVLGYVNNPVSMASEIVRLQITTALIVPNVLNQITWAFEEKLVKGNIAMKFIIVGGKHFPADLKKASIKVFGPIVHEYYGSTETGLNVIASPEDLINVPNSCGKAIDGSTVIVLDENNKPMPAGNKGRVAINSYQNMARYLNAETNKVEIQGEEYIVTPDYGWIDSEGYLYLTSRTDPNINIYPLENSIRHIPGVDDAYIFADGEKVLYCVVAIDRCFRDADVMAEACNILLGAGIKNYKVVSAEIPYSMSGKVDLNKLKVILKGDYRKTRGV